MNNRVLNEAVKVLKQGGVVVYPTDTAYGLAVDATNLKAINRLYRLKGRDFKKPIHVIPVTETSIGIFARISPWAEKLINNFWPGPLTIVLPLRTKSKSWQKLSAGTKTIGVRYPDNSKALALVKALGKPITTTSANVSGQPNCYSIAEVKKQFEKAKFKPDLYLDGGKLRKTKPSTVVSLTKDVKILREGPISKKQIEKCLS